MAFLLAYPLIFMVIFGSAFGGESPPISIDMAIVKAPEMDNDTLAESFIDIFHEYDGINVIETEETGEEQVDQAKKLIEDKDVVAVLFIPQDFSMIVFSSINITIFYDEAADINTRNIAVGTIAGIIDGFARNISEEKIRLAQQYGNITEEEAVYMRSVAQPINATILGVSPMGGRELKYIDFLVPGLVAMSIMWTGVTSSASSLVEDRVRGIRRRILSTPTPRAAIILGDTLSKIVLIGIQVIILLLVAVLIYDLSIIGELWLVALVIIIGMFSMIGIGLVVSSFTKTSDEASNLSMLINFPMMFLAGVFFPISQGWMYYLSRIFPLTYINEALRDVMVRGSSIQDIIIPFIVSIIFAVVIFAIGVVLLSRRGEA
jgi:ABC-2 type transport system permease protein